MGNVLSKREREREKGGEWWWRRGESKGKTKGKRHQWTLASPSPSVFLSALLILHGDLNIAVVVSDMYELRSAAGKEREREKKRGGFCRGF
jgi:hypothetical protein